MSNVSLSDRVVVYGV